MRIAIEIGQFIYIGARQKSRVLHARGVSSISNELQSSEKNKARIAIVLQPAVLSHSRRFEFVIPPWRTWPLALQNLRERGTRVSVKIINAE